jgi:16S rRNA (cytosine1402-N4)-methyltransferase
MMAARSLTALAPLPEGHVHEPVLLQECVELLRPRSGAVIVDATLGTGGHAEALLDRIVPGGRLLGIDRDPAALEIARTRLARFGQAFLALQGRHEELADLVASAGVGAVDGVLADLGVSSLQLDEPSRGFSFRTDGPLDMRMDPSQGRSAAELLGSVPEDELRRWLSDFGEERAARSIARAIVRERERAPIVRTHQLTTIVERVLGPAARRFRIHPATRTFQALRIAVNREVVDLGGAVRAAVALLRPGGRVVVVSYHSLEDRAVKDELRSLAGRCTCPPGLPVCGCGTASAVRILTRSPIRPSPTEVDRNPRSRSAKLRAAEKR